MRSFRAKVGPLKSQPFFSDREIEETCSDELNKLDLLPNTPSPIRIDRFIEKRFVSHTYSEVPEGILGFTKFGPNGVEEIIISQSLEDEDSLVSNRRVRTTLAHEAGHGIFHAHLFATGKNAQKAIFDNDHSDAPKILCRDIHGIETTSKKYDGRWWEYQANKAMGALLLPLPLVELALVDFMEGQGLLGSRHLPEGRRGAPHGI